MNTPSGKWACLCPDPRRSILASKHRVKGVWQTFLSGHSGHARALKREIGHTCPFPLLDGFCAIAGTLGPLNGQSGIRPCSGPFWADLDARKGEEGHGLSPFPAGEGADATKAISVVHFIASPARRRSRSSHSTSRGAAVRPLPRGENTTELINFVMSVGTKPRWSS